MDDSSALKVAISLYLLPAQLPKIKKSPLPKGIESLILIAIGDEKEIQKGVLETQRSKETVKQAAQSFIENILLSSNADSYRILGANSTTRNDELRRNMALMIRYLHPDISQNTNPDLISRVTNAWSDLKTTEKREAYDRQYLLKLKATPQARTRHKNIPKAGNKKQSYKRKKIQPRKRFSYRQYWKSKLLRQLTLFLMKISGR